MIRPSGGSDALPSVVYGGFTVFEWLAEMNTELQNEDPDHEKETRINERLTLIDEFFQSQKLDSRFYRKAPSSDSYAVRGLLKETDPDTPQTMRAIQAAELLYSFFVPPNFAAPILGKYWGAVYFLIQVGYLQWNRKVSSPHSVTRPIVTFIEVAIRLAGG
jgi:hypothetical protein